jgi:hypothetical protein
MNEEDYDYSNADIGVKQKVQNQNLCDDKPPQRCERRRPPVDKRWQKLLIGIKNENQMHYESCNNDPATEQSSHP